MKTKTVYLTAFLLSLFITANAQLTDDLNKLLPSEMTDERYGITRSVNGTDFMVMIAVVQGIKNQDACSESEFGKLNLEIMWYDPNSELGKSQIQLINMLKADEQQKTDFLGERPYDELAGGSYVSESNSKPCVNTISGETGKTEYITKAKFFMYTGNAIIKMSFNGKLKPDKVKNIVSNTAEQIKSFDFTIYKNINAAEKSR